MGLAIAEILAYWLRLRASPSNPPAPVDHISRALYKCPIPYAGKRTMPLSPYTALDLTEGGFNWCGKLLADLGADVIKVEPPGGSPTRKIGPFIGPEDERGPDSSLFWAAYCVNKRSVTLDLESEDDRARFRELARSADFLIESFKPGYMASLGLGYDDLIPSNSGLVYTSITPYGQTGPYADHDAPDLVAWAMGGMQYICGDKDRPPVRISAPQAQLHAAGQAAAGTMAAFWHRQQTGQGQHVDVSMQLAVVWTLMNATPFPPLHGINIERDGAFRSRGPLSTRQVFTCADGHVSIVSSPRTLSGMTEWMIEEGVCPDWMIEIDWEDGGISPNDLLENPDAMARFEAVQTEMERFVATKSKRALYQRAIDRGILLAPCHTVQDISESEQLAARDFWIDLEHPANGRKLTHLGPFIKFGQSPIRLAAPRAQSRRTQRPSPRISAQERRTFPLYLLPLISSYLFTTHALHWHQSPRLLLGRRRPHHYQAPGRLRRGRNPRRIGEQAGYAAERRPVQGGHPGHQSQPVLRQLQLKQARAGAESGDRARQRSCQAADPRVEAGCHRGELHAARDARIGPGVRRRSQARSGRHLLQHLPAGSDGAALRLRGLRNARRSARGLLPHHRLARPRTRGALWRVFGLRESAERRRRDRRRSRIPATHRQGTASRPVAVRVRHALSRARDHGLHDERTAAEPARQRRRHRCASQRVPLRRLPPRLHRRRRTVDRHSRIGRRPVARAVRSDGTRRSCVRHSLGVRRRTPREPERHRRRHSVVDAQTRTLATSCSGFRTRGFPQG